MEENSLYDKKSLREITGKSADWKPERVQTGTKWRKTVWLSVMHRVA